MKYQRFEELPVWQMSRELCREVYQSTDQSKLAKDFSLRDQIWRAAGSVMDNIHPVKYLERT
jgi:four helix bundle protein